MTKLDYILFTLSHFLTQLTTNHIPIGQFTSAINYFTLIHEISFKFLCGRFKAFLLCSMALDDSDSDTEGLVPDVSVQVPLADVATQISMSVTESLRYNLQEWFPTENLENRIAELAEAVEISRHKHELNDNKLVKLGEAISALKIELQTASISRKRLEDKLDSLISIVSAKEAQGIPPSQPTPPTQAPANCFFCDSTSHLFAACPAREKCVGCGSDSHPYTRCEAASSNCDRCGLLGHNARLHLSTNLTLRGKLIQLHPVEFNHFLAPEPVRPPRTRSSRGPRVGLQRPHDQSHGFTAPRNQEQDRSAGQQRGSRNQEHDRNSGQPRGSRNQEQERNAGQQRGRGGYGRGRGFSRPN